MHRLSRHILCPGSLPRAIHTQRLPYSLRAVSPRLRRQYASSNGPSSPSEKFDKLYASLRPTMPMEQLAVTYAALFTSTKDQDRLGKLQKVVSTYLSIGGISEEAFYTRVNDLLSNPPKDVSDPLTEPPPIEASNQLSNTSSKTPPESNEPSTSYPNVHRARPGEQTLKSLPEQPADVNQEYGNDLEKPKEPESVLKTSGESAAFETEQRAVDPVLEMSEEGVALNNEASGPQPVSELVESELKAAGNKTQGRLTRQERASKLRELKRKQSAYQYEFSDGNYPNLIEADPLLDYRDVLELPPDNDTRFHNRVIVRNHTSIFNEALAGRGSELNPEDYEPTTTDETEESASSLENLPLTPREQANLYRFPLVHKRITQQTGKGKIHRQFVLIVVGDGNGMVGLGQGKDDDASRAEAKAFAQAVRNMDWVARFENRTIWTEMEAKLGATQLILRPRPVGFGLRCNPNLHQVLKAAGIKDISAKVWGSRNPINVIKAAFRMLQAGHAPLAMGDGIGGPGRKLNKGHGLRSKDEVERERGRQLVSLRK